MGESNIIYNYLGSSGFTNSSATVFQEFLSLSWHERIKFPISIKMKVKIRQRLHLFQSKALITEFLNSETYIRPVLNIFFGWIFIQILYASPESIVLLISDGLILTCAGTGSPVSLPHIQHGIWAACDTICSISITAYHVIGDPIGLLGAAPIKCLLQLLEPCVRLTMPGVSIWPKCWRLIAPL